jgi:hypothetical protein
MSSVCTENATRARLYSVEIAPQERFMPSKPPLTLRLSLSLKSWLYVLIRHFSENAGGRVRIACSTGRTVRTQAAPDACRPGRRF